MSSPYLHLTIADERRVRQHIRNGHEDFVVTADSWPAFLFPHGQADPEDIEKGLFRSAVILKVRTYSHIPYEY